MSGGFSLIPVLYLLGAAHGVYLALALFTQKTGPRRANQYLACYTLVFVCALFDYFLDLTGLINQYVYIRTLLWPKEFLYGIFIYFYARELTHPGQYHLVGRQWLHFVPALLHVAITWPLLFFSPEFQIRILTNAPNDSFFEMAWALLAGDVELLLTVFQITVYIVLSIQFTAAYQITLKNQFANLERINVRWLQSLLIGTLVVYFIWLVDEFIDLGAPVDFWLDSALGLSMVGLIYGMSILGLRQSKPITLMRDEPDSAAALSVPVIDDTKTEVDGAEKPKRYEKSALSEDLSSQLFEELQQLMQTEKLYSDNSLSLPKLAEASGVSANYLSQVINQQSGENFFDFVNGYRVNEVQTQMVAKPDATVLDLAMNSGFNSKSAFYTAFRKHTGQTPSQFKKSLVVSR